jgi:diaminopimelate epimerase
MYTRIESLKRISLFPWERGSGATMACGSGAAAATVISNLLELTEGAVAVRMPGGSLSTRWDIENNRVYQQGPARIAFSGIYNS